MDPGRGRRFSQLTDPWPVAPGSGERLLGQLLGNASAAAEQAQGPDQPRANPLAELDRARLVVHSLSLSRSLLLERLRRPAGSLLARMLYRTSVE
jgi:hypothetical protein